MKINQSNVFMNYNENKQEIETDQLAINILRSNGLGKVGTNERTVKQTSIGVNRGVEELKLLRTNFKANSYVNDVNNKVRRETNEARESESRDYRSVGNSSLLARESSAGDDENSLSIHMRNTNSYMKNQDLYFSSRGKVQTADGREIEFEMGFTRDDHYERKIYDEGYFTTTERKAPLNDPLVLNFDGRGARLTDEKIQFDLDSDGKSDDISFLEKGSGFLVMDKNEDGKVNDGNELFGVKSGDGFADLRTYDSDNNGWIDENDEAYEKLKVWTKDSRGRDVLTGLKEMDVGAMYLGKKNASYDIDGGRVSGMGMYLTEDGRSRILQQVDLEQGLKESESESVENAVESGEEKNPLLRELEKLKKMAEVAFSIENQVKMSLREIKVKKDQWNKTKNGLLADLLEKLTEDFKRLKIHQFDLKLTFKG